MDEKDIGTTSLVSKYIDEIKTFRESLAGNYREHPYELFDILQGIGSNLRKCANPFDDASNITTAKNLAIIAERAGNILKLDRKARKKVSPTFYVIECFRNPAEVEYFRRRFYAFYLISIFADASIRFKRAGERHNLNIEDCMKIDKIDQGGNYSKNPHQQNIKRCVYLADITVANNRRTAQVIEGELIKYYTMIRKPGQINPNYKERNMNLAYSMSLNSGCICRQVGAVIVREGYVVGAGWNDTDGSRWGCLFRHKRDIMATDNTSFPLCSNGDYEDFKKMIIEDETRLDESFCYKDEYTKYKKLNREMPSENVEKYTGNEETNPGSLQYCRALHAEENAILQAVKIGGANLKGATLYTTTFPCELCAKKILQVGINRIFYCEPYPKSVSQEVFFKEGTAKIDIVPFEGVKSPSFYRLFKPPLDIKDQQRLDAMGDGDF